MQKIFLVRHGETEWSVLGKHTGKTDIALTQKGEGEAKSLAPILQKIEFNRAFVSPLQRASHTFDLLQIPVQKELDSDLIEWDYGKYEGLTSLQIRQICPDWTVFSKGALEGESLDDIQKRANRLVLKIRGCQGNILLCSSGHILRAFTTAWLQTPLALGDKIPLGTGALSVLGYEKEIPSLLIWNYKPHIVF